MSYAQELGKLKQQENEPIYETFFTAFRNTHWWEDPETGKSGWYILWDVNMKQWLIYRTGYFAEESEEIIWKMIFDWGKDNGIKLTNGSIDLILKKLKSELRIS